MLNKLLALLGAGMLSFSSPLYAVTPSSPGTLPVVSETTIPAAQLVQPAVLQTTQPAPQPIEDVVATDEQTECVATAMYYEAKGEPLAGKKAVGYVILNRVKAGLWRSTPCGVVTQKAQFSWYRPGTIGKIPTNVKTVYMTLASTVMNTYSKANDPTGGATHFHATYVSPGWRGVIRLLRIGGHIFYRQRGITI
jgi:spore germination cell wall hydrolase CwlJ-like protein